MNKANILIIDDEPECLEICQLKLGNRYNVITASNTAIAAETLNTTSIDCILTDLVMPDVDGLEFVELLQTNYPDIPVILMSGKATVKIAVQAIKAGAFDLIEKPFLDLDLIPAFIDKALKSRSLIDENKELKKRLSTTFIRHNFVGNSLKIQELLNLIQKIAGLNTTVLIEGDTGTGKEMVADLIHRNSSRADQAFVPVNCGAIPDTLLESLFFGHTKGSFTGAVKDTKGFFEEANKGTLFLDEIGDTSLPFQIKLLRVLQERKIRRVGGEKDIDIDVRIIAATNKNLEEEVNNDRFRKDLYYRLNVIRLHVPSLEERKDDIPLLVNHFLKIFETENNVKGYKISNEALNVLKNAIWHGNIRELQNVIEHSSALCKDQSILAEDLPEYLLYQQPVCRMESFPHDYNAAKKQFEVLYFEQLLKRTQKNIIQASKESGLTRQYIYEKLKVLNIEK